MRTLFYIVGFAFCIGNYTVSSAQSPDLDRLLSRAQTQYPQVDSLDRISYQLHFFNDHTPSPEEQEKLMEIYKAISNGYSVNIHYKQGYEAFNKYLSLKEKKIAAEKNVTVEKEKLLYDQKDKNDESEVSTLELQVRQLDEDTNGLISRRSLFKKLFSAIIAFLSLLFGLSLFRSGVKMKNLRHETQSNRDTVMSNHRIALLGSFTEGLKAAIGKNFLRLKQDLSALISKWKGNTENLKKINGKLNEVLKDIH